MNEYPGYRALSGENVAFVLVLCGPVLRRLRLGPRWATTLMIIAFFALLTRFEPSVLRAASMAGLTATAFLLGRPASGVRLLALAVSALVLVDPLLVRSVGFRLSVAASAGILVVAPVLRRLLPGPWFVVEPLAVTAGAQLAVAPVLVATFGGLPVASLPANLLAGPAAGLVMTWGLGAGIPAGLMGGSFATLAHGPTSLLVGWVAAVARQASSLPLGELGPLHLVVLTAALGIAGGGRHLGRRAPVVAAGMVAMVTLVVPAIGLRRDPPLRRAVAPSIDLWRSDGATVLVVAGGARGDVLLEALRRAGVRRIDLLVAVRGRPADAAVLGTLAHRWPPRRTWAPDGHQIPTATVPGLGHRLRLGGLDVTVEAVRPTLVIAIANRSPSDAAVGPGPGERRVASARVARARDPPIRRHPPGHRHGDPQSHA